MDNREDREDWEFCHDMDCPRLFSLKGCTEGEPCPHIDKVYKQLGSIYMLDSDADKEHFVALLPGLGKYLRKLNS